MRHVAAQPGIEDPSCVKHYAERDRTRLEHTWKIAKASGLKDFSARPRANQQRTTSPAGAARNLASGRFRYFWASAACDVCW
ncbi:DUF4158 domain-containing protein [Nonomuraea spiralis]|uniref:DUF4158 domain-containing protein n=1 Tax=Nonomuraea spiralis TaxID=46182 RepID=A0ABV5IN87_9ACTN|nr:DUF4158 domain-containing protein [Nonomuraea spiralis]GGT25732.1 hypothetical protein GCM10010176_082910 [Nonomuraea spiralis]